MTPLYPLLFEPPLKDYVWGGRNLAQRFGRILPPDTPIAESWEIAAHPDGTGTVANGPLTGTDLQTLVDRLGADLVGTRSAWATERGKFPLLVKLLDANQALSVQVHPDDAYALAHEGNELGKTEMWVVLHAEPGAGIILGVKDGVSAESFRTALAAGALEPLLHRLPVQSGDFVCVPAGTLHAILDGLIIAEIQQNSNTTYRVYDWNRPGKDGRPRPLHVDKALDVIDFGCVEPTIGTAQPLPAATGVRRERLCHNRYFSVERWQLPAGGAWDGATDGSTFEIWGTLSGSATVSGGGMDVALPAVQFALLPAGIGRFRLTTTAPTTLLRAYVP